MTLESQYPGKLALQQRVLAAYRIPFLDALAKNCEGGLSVSSGMPRPGENIAVGDKFLHARYTLLHNYHLFSGRSYLCYQRGLLTWVKQNSPDALIVEANPRYLSTPAAIRWMKRNKKPVIGWGLGVTPGASPSKIPISYFKNLVKASRIGFLNSFDALITYSRRGAREYTAFGYPEERIFIAPNAVAPRPAQAVPAREASNDHKLTVLFVGRLQVRKRIDLLLQACAALPENVKPRLLIVGDGPLRTSLEALAQTIYPLAEFPGALYGHEVAAYFSMADLFVLPGTGGLAVQEAMSHGLPVIMGKGDGTNDDLVRPANGWQLQDESLSALTEVMGSALSDLPRLRKMGVESYRIVSDEINLENMVSVFLHALQFVKTN